MHAVTVGNVHHVQRDDQRNVEVEQFGREVQPARKARRIDDVHDDVDLGVEQEVARDAGVLRIGRVDREQAVDAGQIDHFQSCVAVAEVSRLALDGDAGPVADALVRAGQRVEHRGLAGVRIADERDRGHAFSNCRPRASLGRNTRHAPRN